MVPTSIKKPKSADAVLGSGRVVAGLAKLSVRALDQSSAAMNGRLTPHISYSGITIMMRKLIDIRMSPVSIDITNIGDTYEISQGEIRSRKTPPKAIHVAETFTASLAIVKYNTCTRIIKTTGIVNR